MGKRGVVCATQLQATAALLALNPEDSKAIQKVDPLKFIVFDCLHDGESLIDKPWEIRHPHAEKIANLLKQAGFTCEINPVVRTNKLEFYSDIVERGDEGVVFKNVNAPYHATTSRTVDQVKLKRTISEGLNKDLDAWVTGFIPSDPNKGWSDLIGALVFSCKVRMKDGTIKDHVIGACSGISYELRKAATVLIDGKPSINPDFLGRVATLSGQNISARKLALTHCVIQTWRPDKDPSGCEILEEEELLKQVF
jgi:ATP-dependent DNA ligase